MKLLLNTVLPYAAYKVKYAYRCPENHENDYEAEFDVFNRDELNCLVNFSGFYLILRPLSDLIDINSLFYSESNIDLTDQIELNSLIDEILFDEQSYKTIEDIPYKYMAVLFKYHIDIFGLIDQRKAIDINTI